MVRDSEPFRTCGHLGCELVKMGQLEFVGGGGKICKKMSRCLRQGTIPKPEPRNHCMPRCPNPEFATNTLLKAPKRCCFHMSGQNGRPTLCKHLQRWRLKGTWKQPFRAPDASPCRWPQIQRHSAESPENSVNSATTLVANFQGA